MSVIKLTGALTIRKKYQISNFKSILVVEVTVIYEIVFVKLPSD